jgi:hypothetical protein
VTHTLGGVSAVRPDALRITVDGSLAGTVVMRTFRRDHFLVRVALDGRDETLEVAIRGDAPPATGERVRLTADQDGVVPLTS